MNLMIFQVHNEGVEVAILLSNINPGKSYSPDNLLASTLSEKGHAALKLIALALTLIFQVSL